MLITGRQAARTLRDVLSSDEQARLLLRTGIAGLGVATSAGTLFEALAVDDLRLRRVVDEQELARVCPQGLYVARLPRTAGLDLTRPWQDVADQVARILADQRPMTTLSAALTSLRVTWWRSLPFVATFVGYVVLAADLVELTERGPRLEAPGDWAHAVDRRRFHTPPGGRPSYVWTPRPG